MSDDAIACLDSLTTLGSLRDWALAAIVASYPVADYIAAGEAATEYIDWLDSLPVLGGSDND